MNFLAHHAVARTVWPTAPPEFFVGAVLPDLLADARVRAAHLAPDDRRPLIAGIRVHLESDRRFHGAAAFKSAMADVSATLRATPFSFPPRRLFFVAHIFVEIGLDGVLIRADAAIADDLYAQMDAADLDATVAETVALLGRPLPRLLRYLDGFRSSRYLYDYADDAGLAEAVVRVCHRAGLAENFASAFDRKRLAEAFAVALPSIADARSLLLPILPPVVQ